MIIEILIFFSSILFLFHLFNAIHYFYMRNKTKIITNTRQTGFSILIPCFDEEFIITKQINKFFEVDYQNYEIILIDDGSSDKTFDKINESLVLQETLRPKSLVNENCKVFRSCLYPNFYVLLKENSGKGDSLNKALALASKPYIITLDADSYLNRNSLKVLNNYFQDPSVIAAGGAIHILQGGKEQGRSIWQSILINLQMIDYMKGFYIYKASLAKQNAIAIISGAFGAFKKEYIEKVGGFRTSLGEDIDLTLKLQLVAQEENKKVIYIPEALCYTQCPENIKDLTKQRMRWQKGFIDCVVHFRKKLIKQSLSKSLSFHFFIEAFLIGTLSAVFSFSTLLYLIVTHEPQSLIIYGVYLLMRIFIRTIYAVASFCLANKLHKTKPRLDRAFWLSALIDLSVYGWYLMSIYITGTIQYFWQGEKYYKWNKVKRNEII